MAALASKDLYTNLQDIKLSEADLQQFCCPRAHWQPGHVLLYNIDQSCNRFTCRSGQRICVRCGANYLVDSEGYVCCGGADNTEVICNHHCCKSSSCMGDSSCHVCNRPLDMTKYPHCSTHLYHVSDEIETDTLTGFINTNLKESISEKSIYALSCDMVYTTTGLEVAAISMVNSDCQVVYETKVKPKSTIIDYNTEHSEIIMEEYLGLQKKLSRRAPSILKEIKRRLSVGKASLLRRFGYDGRSSRKKVHKKLLKLIGSDTILIGHDLGFHLLRLRVIHDNIVDTVALYPHENGFPNRISLASLKSKYLKCTTTTVLGFKCRGDAQTAMQLVKLKC
nr:exonuclease GOR-like [Cherax quadricarinatus]